VLTAHLSIACNGCITQSVVSEYWRVDTYAVSNVESNRVGVPEWGWDGRIVGMHMIVRGGGVGSFSVGCHAAWYKNGEV
jgi:hypothetical protein